MQRRTNILSTIYLSHNRWRMIRRRHPRRRIEQQFLSSGCIRPYLRISARPYGALAASISLRPLLVKILTDRTKNTRILPAQRLIWRQIHPAPPKLCCSPSIAAQTKSVYNSCRCHMFFAFSIFPSSIRIFLHFHQDREPSN